MKKLKFIICQPSESYYIWQVNMWLESAKEFGYSSDVDVLIYHPAKGPGIDIEWERLANRYPESHFHIYEDDTMFNLRKIYVSIIRPFVLAKHFEKFPELKEYAIFYCDSDIIFTRKMNLDQYINNETCYLSDTKSYINADYFDSKVNDVLPSKLEQYKQRDILEEIAKISHINRRICVGNNNNAGGAQYLLKNVDSDFWWKVLNSTIVIKIHLDNVNSEFFEDGSKGFQSWCADMWGVLHTLWETKHKTRIIKELEFAWAGDNISKIKEVAIYHNAGITSEANIKVKGENRVVDCPAFYKGNYVKRSPFKDLPHLKSLSMVPLLQTFCNGYYLNKLLELQEKYSLQY